MKILILLVATMVIASGDAFFWRKKKCNTVCTTDYNPVCGSDGHRYSNLCEFEKQRCLSGDYKLTEVPCEKPPPKKCPDWCTKEYDPVCGSDKVTYSNKCEFLKAQCKDPTLTLKKRGKCDPIVTPPPKKCPEWCTKEYYPVCGSDKVTYTNKCEFLKARCKNPTLTLKKSGKCDPIVTPPPKKCPEWCTKEYYPVCGSDKVTYSNKCEFLKAQCKNPTLTLKKSGKCGPVVTPPPKKCPEWCTKEYYPVCGSDKVTYSNKCEFLKAQCKDPTLKLKGHGECDYNDVYWD